jgi:NADPH-dependent 2,4-dienoyl-CoA reductase/sulfur reductase-like enzyme
VTTTRTILIIGGGPAGVYAAMAAKKQDAAANVVLLTDETCEPYEKPPLSKAVLLGKARAADAPIAGPGGIEAHGVTLEPGARCLAIDRPTKHVVLAGGRRLAYDALVIATGAVVRELPLLPIGIAGVHYLRNVSDAEALRAAFQTCRRLLVVGGGLIGLEAAASAAELGITVTVLEVAPRILARVCYAEIGALVHAVHRQRGVDIRLDTILESAERTADGQIVVTTRDGQTLTADTVVVGTGARPDDALAAAAGLETQDGIVVDEYCRTSDPAIFAAGDATRFPGPAGAVRLENWRHALDHGTVAGRNAAGADDAYRAVPSFWSEQYDLYIQGIGWPGGTGHSVARPLPGHAALSFEVSQGRLTYALGVNAQRELAVARRLIERRVPVDPAELADPAQPLAAMLKRG